MSIRDINLSVRWNDLTEKQKEKINLENEKVETTKFETQAAMLRPRHAKNQIGCKYLDNQCVIRPIRDGLVIPVSALRLYCTVKNEAIPRNLRSAPRYASTPLCRTLKHSIFSCNNCTSNRSTATATSKDRAHLQPLYGLHAT